MPTLTISNLEGQTHTIEVKEKELESITLSEIKLEIKTKWGCDNFIFMAETQDFPVYSDKNFRDILKKANSVDIAIIYKDKKNIDDILLEKCLSSRFIKQYQIKSLVDEGANIDHFKNDWTPLTALCNYNNLETMKYIIDEGADINKPNLYGDTPLNIAIFNRKLPIIHYLIEKGANINLQNDTGYSPLNVASVSGHTKIIKYLISKKADMNLTNNNGETPFITACLHRNLDALMLLKKNKANINHTDHYGNTALHKVTELGLFDMAKFLLLKLYADPTIKNNDSKTPIDIAYDNGDLNLIDMFSYYQNINNQRLLNQTSIFRRYNMSQINADNKYALSKNDFL